MRYRRLSYRYTEIFHPSAEAQLGDRWAARPAELVSPQWRPPADLYETPREIVVKAELAGISEDALVVTLFEDALVIEGKRDCPLPAGDTRFYAAEIRYGPFRLEVQVPTAVDRDRVTARYENGFLFVTLPRGGAHA